MRRKVKAEKASPRAAQGNANINIKAKENTHLKVIKQIMRPTKTQTGKGLGKAGAKRLGRLLKRAIQDQENPTVTGKLSLPSTPVRLFKLQIQTEAENAPKTNTAKQASPHVSPLILSVVSQYKNQGGITMAELKQTLAAGGYDVTKNSRQVNVVTNRLINNKTLVQTTRNVSFRLNNKKQKDTKRVRTRSVKSPEQKGDLRRSKTASNSPKGAEKLQRQARKSPKTKGKTQKPKSKPCRAAAAKSNKLTAKTRKPSAKSYKQTAKTNKPAAKSNKQTPKTHKPAAKSHKPRMKTPKARKSPKPAGKKRGSATNQAAQVRKAPRKAQRRQRKQNQHPYKSSRKRQPPRRRLPKTRQLRQVARRRAYY